jgi:2-polyprenyl-6-methoxyphenol hydroxylase-like FAD-dependent oxidoreductase
MAFTQQLRTPTIYNAIKHAKLLGEVVRYGFPESTLRHYEQLESFPRGVLPLGDAVCRFNPVYGQGMSVAAQEARALGHLLEARASVSDPLDGLAPAFLAEAAALIDTPWAGSVIPDFVYPDTRGERPADFEVSIKYGMALGRLAARDPDVHRLTAEVSHLLKPRRAYRDPELVQRVMAVMADG